jgi:hypothetical protein
MPAFLFFYLQADNSKLIPHLTAFYAEYIESSRSIIHPLKKSKKGG